MPARGKTNGKYQGAKWISRERRLAIYIRDGLACVYCGSSMEDGISLTLDHIIPHANGGSTASDNLVTSCMKCNSSRGDRPVPAFIRSVAEYLNRGTDLDKIRDHINRCVKRSVNIAQAKQLIKRRGGYMQALQAANGGS